MRRQNRAFHQCDQQRKVGATVMMVLNSRRTWVLALLNAALLLGVALLV